jgi:hypothetical protein
VERHLCAHAPAAAGQPCRPGRAQLPGGRRRRSVWAFAVRPRRSRCGGDRGCQAQQSRAWLPMWQASGRRAAGTGCQSIQDSMSTAPSAQLHSPTQSQTKLSHTFSWASWPGPGPSHGTPPAPPRAMPPYPTQPTQPHPNPMPAEADKLVVGADNSLQAYDGVTGFRKWGIDFGTPPIGAFTADGEGARHGRGSGPWAVGTTASTSRACASATAAPPCLPQPCR